MLKSKEVIVLKSEASLVSVKKNIEIISKICEENKLNLAKVKNGQFINVHGYEEEEDDEDKYDQEYEGLMAFTYSKLPITESTKVTINNSFDNQYNSGYFGSVLAFHLYNLYETVYNNKKYHLKLYSYDHIGTESEGVVCLKTTEVANSSGYEYVTKLEFTKKYDKLISILGRESRSAINNEVLKTINEHKLEIKGTVPDKIKKLLNFS